jgi:hypothetical protein
MEFEEGLRIVPVTIGAMKYELREATGEAATAWRNAKTEALQLKDGKPVGAKGMASTDPLLLSRCLFDPSNKLVPLVTILAWKDKVQKMLVERLLEISDLATSDDTIASLEADRDRIDERIVEMEEEAKNDESSSEAGSD